MENMLELWWVAYIAAIVNGDSNGIAHHVADTALSDYLEKKKALQLIIAESND